jgi:hypothetical protein
MVKRHVHKWSAKVTRQSDALDLQEDVFKSGDPAAIARSLKHSAETSHPPKGQSIPLGHVDADILHEPGRKKLIRPAPPYTGAGEDQLAKGLPS